MVLVEFLTAKFWGPAADIIVWHIGWTSISRFHPVPFSLLGAGPRNRGRWAYGSVILSAMRRVSEEKIITQIGTPNLGPLQPLICLQYFPFNCKTINRFSYDPIKRQKKQFCIFCCDLCKLYSYFNWLEEQFRQLGWLKMANGQNGNLKSIIICIEVGSDELTPRRRKPILYIDLF